jgi:DNA-directed RNA polymerase subunit K/omega
VVQRPSGTNAFEFVVVSGLRAAQLMRGSVPRVERAHKVITTAQLEVASGKVSRIPAGALPIVAPE